MNFYKKQLLCVISLLSCTTYHSNKTMFPTIKALYNVKKDLFDQDQTNLIKLLETKKKLQDKTNNLNACFMNPEKFFREIRNQPLQPKQ